MQLWCQVGKADPVGGGSGGVGTWYEYYIDGLLTQEIESPAWRVLPATCHLPRVSHFTVGQSKKRPPRQHCAHAPCTHYTATSPYIALVEAVIDASHPRLDIRIEARGARSARVKTEQNYHLSKGWQVQSALRCCPTGRRRPPRQGSYSGPRFERGTDVPALSTFRVDAR
jgi:hypothetical protein